jgi:hypothetical protein
MGVLDDGKPFVLGTYFLDGGATHLQSVWRGFYIGEIVTVHLTALQNAPIIKWLALTTNVLS